MRDEDGNVKSDICQDSDLNIECYTCDHLNYGHVAQKAGFNIFHCDFPGCPTSPRGRTFTLVLHIAKLFNSLTTLLTGNPITL